MVSGYSKMEAGYNGISVWRLDIREFLWALYIPTPGEKRVYCVLYLYCDLCLA